MHDWQTRVDAVWRDANALGDDAVLERIAALAAELPADDPRGPFELAGAYDSAGREAEAEPHYRRALESGLGGRQRVECLIQLASTLRNLGRPEESIALLDEAAREPHDLGDAVSAFRALALTSAGRPDAAASVALAVLAAHLPQYGRAVAAYAAELDSGDAPSA
ncbi:tetratricopeptide repeat protein [Agromyces sp. G08B096]|uniref:Tetratricopeptide repeat protein n=1 Tax=Agromyces sp. G08B096 TaxID=3156399 RepID=A0AAU7WBC1_9MICO